MSKINSLKNTLIGASQMILIGVIAPFKPINFFALMARASKKKNWKLIGQSLLLMALIMALTIDILSPVILIPIFIAFIIPILMIVSIDPFVSYIRGDDDFPKRTIARYFTQGIWAVIISLIPFIIIMIAIFFGMMSGAINEETIIDFLNQEPGGESLINSGNVASFLFMVLFSINFVFSQIAIPDTRKEHKVIASICILSFVLITPIINYFG